MYRNAWLYDLTSTFKQYYLVVQYGYCRGSYAYTIKCRATPYCLCAYGKNGITPCLYSRVSRLSALPPDYLQNTTLQVFWACQMSFVQLVLPVNLRFLWFTGNTSWTKLVCTCYVEHVLHLRESSFTSLTSSGPTDVLHTCLVGGWYYFLARTRNLQPTNWTARYFGLGAACRKVV